MCSVSTCITLKMIIQWQFGKRYVEKHPAYVPGLQILYLYTKPIFGQVLCVTLQFMEQCLMFRILVFKLGRGWSYLYRWFLLNYHSNMQWHRMSGIYNWFLKFWPLQHPHNHVAAFCNLLLPASYKQSQRGSQEKSCM